MNIKEDIKEAISNRFKVVSLYSMKQTRSKHPRRVRVLIGRYHVKDISLIGDSALFSCERAL